MQYNNGFYLALIAYYININPVVYFCIKQSYYSILPIIAVVFVNIELIKFIHKYKYIFLDKRIIVKFRQLIAELFVSICVYNVFIRMFR